MMDSIEDHRFSMKPMLEETFYILSKKNTVYRVKLTEKGLSLQKENNGSVKTETIALCDIIGCRCMRSKRRSEKTSCACHPSSSRKNDPRVVDENSVDKDENDISAYLYIYAYVLKNCKVKSGQKRERMTITLRFRSFDKYDDNMKEAQKWRSSIKYLINARYSPQISPGLSPTGGIGGNPVFDNKLLVIINPKSGVGKARDIFQARVVPILTEADINYDLHVTRHSHDARSLVRTQDINQYRSGIVGIGGDGILFEIINGLLERIDWEVTMERAKLGIIPCGSGNGLAKTISFAYNEPYDQNPVLVSTLNIVKGITAPMDLVRVQTQSQVLFSFLSVGWGLLSDIDIESERLRAIGSQRFTVWSVARLIGLRTYRGRLSYCLIPNERLCLSRNDSTALLTRSISDCMDLNLPLHPSSSFGDCINLETSSEVSDCYRRDSFYSVASRQSTYLSAAGSSYQSLVEGNKSNVQMYGPPSKLPPLSQPVPDSWHVVEGDFVMVHAAYQTHLAADCIFAPDSKLSDGVIWLSIIKAGISRAHLLQYLLGLSSGSHVNVTQTELIPVSAFRLEPESTGSHVTVDGELVEYGPLQAEIVPGLANVLSHRSF
ncbi:sphingosine kinase 1-like [Lycorma delicatula]|uniref:sphingosine kinase 1-like n=1 Tax=Lycorma delicatula TaxID=130591 RepID=UPI003F512302